VVWIVSFYEFLICVSDLSEIEQRIKVSKTKFHHILFK